MSRIKAKYCSEDIALDLPKMMRARDKLAGIYRLRYLAAQQSENTPSPKDHPHA